MKQKKIIIVLSIIAIVIVGILLFLNKDNIYKLVNGIKYVRNFEITDLQKTEKIIITFTDTTDKYINFNILNKNGVAGEEYYLNSVFTLTKISNAYSGKKIVAVIEKSEDNVTFTSASEVEVSLNNEIKLQNDELLKKGQNYYRISFKIDNNEINLKEDNILGKLNVKTNVKYKYDYSDNGQNFTAPVDGEYKIELWGASGNSYNNAHSVNSGRGAYTSGIIKLVKGTKLYIYTGKNAQDGESNGNSWYSSNLGGGGSAGGYDISWKKHWAASGGGATDVRLVGGAWANEEGLNSRIMVAAGGGGSLYGMSLVNTYMPECSGSGGSGGGLVGYQGIIASVDTDQDVINRYPTGGTQTSGGKKGICESVFGFVLEACSNVTMYQGSFGYGGKGYTTKPFIGNEKFGFAASGAGGGYYGGSGGTQGVSKLFDEGIGHTSGAGGSSYISGHTGSIAIKSSTDRSPKCTENLTSYTPNSYVGTTDNSCSIHYSNLSFYNTVMIDGEGYSWSNKREGKSKMPSYDGTVFESGNTGSGAARITLLSDGATSESMWEKIETEVIPIKITVKYVDENGVEISDSTIITNEDDKTEYKTEPKEIEGYKLVETPENASGNFPNEDIVVSYKYEKIIKVTVKYLDESGVEISPSLVITNKDKDAYETNAKEIEGYKLVEIPENASGSFPKEDITVSYKYEKIIKVTVKYVDESGIEISPSLVITNKDIDAYETNAKEIEGYKLVEIPENASGNFPNEDTTISYKYEKIVKITVKYVDESGKEIFPSETITNKDKIIYETNAKEIEGYKLVETPENASGSFPKTDIIILYKYEKIPTSYIKITVEYVDENGNSISPSLVITNEDGKTTYETNVKEIEGYKLVEIPENASGSFPNEDIVVSYKYEKIVKITVKYVDENGNVISEPEIITNEDGKTTYETTPKEIEGYKMVETPENASGSFPKKDTIISYIYLKIVKITVKYVDSSGKVLLDSEIITNEDGKSMYETTPKEIEGYKIKEMPENASGSFPNEDIIISYEYEKVQEVKVENTSKNLIISIFVGLVFIIIGSAIFIYKNKKNKI